MHSYPNFTIKDQLYASSGKNLLSRPTIIIKTITNENDYKGYYIRNLMEATKLGMARGVMF